MTPGPQDPAYSSPLQDYERGWPRPGAHGRARPSAVSLFVGLSTRGLAAVRTRHR
jgi:hypothetical protein